MTINLNDEVEIDLTEKGIAIYKEYCKNLFNYYDRSGVIELYAPKLHNNKVILQLYEVFEIFGAHLHLAPFNFNVRLIGEK